MAAQLAHELLTAAEVRELTGAGKPEDQARTLSQDGIPHRLRGGRVLVSRFHVREWLAGRVVMPSRGVNLSLVR